MASITIGSDFGAQKSKVSYCFPIYLPLSHYLTFPAKLLLSRFSRVRLCANQWTAAHQAPPPLGFSRQEHRSGLPFSSPMHESEK